MSLSIQVRPWAEDSVGLMKVCDSAGSDEEGLHLKLDRCDGSDSGCQIEDDLSPLGLIDSLTYNRSLSEINVISEEENRIVADVMERILSTVEERVGSAYQREVVELESRSREEIDCDRSRERGKSRHRKADNPKKAVRRKRERSDDKKKSRRRSTSCSTTSSACSADYPRKHRRKHKHHRRSHDGHSPRVNPIFLWVKQDDTRIVEVLCEDYDKRNRIRLTKTAQGWRAIPRTERLASALSNRSSLDISNTDQPTLALVNPVEINQETTSDKTYPDTKDEEVKSENETICVLDDNENCDKEVESTPFNVEPECKNESNNLDSVNMDNKSENRLESENSNIAMEECDDKCHEDLIEEVEDDDNKTVEDIEDVYTFVPTPKTDTEEVIQERLRNEDTLDDDIFANDVEECTEEDIEMDELENDLSNTEESLASLIPIDLVVENKNKSNNIINHLIKSEDKVVKKVSSLNEIWRIPEETTVQQTVMPIKSLPEARPAHQQSKTKFLETILSGPPQKCHKEVEKNSISEQEEPLDLGISRKSASPTVSSSDTRKVSTSDSLEPALKKMKVEDITLKAILISKNKETTKTKSNKFKDTNEDQQAVDSTTKSRLLELLTSESALDENKSDPLTQLKEVLSDPELIVPDPLLVPRARLSALVANPAKEIPRLLSQKSEAYSYPKLLTDPDLLVVSLSHLQTLLQSTGKDEDMMRYQQHAQYLQHQLKQEQSTLDAATANALNQMLWLPYLSQLEAAAMACGNNQEFLTMLNLVFPPNGYGQIPYMGPTSPAMNGYDYKNQLEFQQALAMWQEAMLHAASSGQLPNQTVGLNNNISKPQQETKFNPKQFHQQSARHHESVKQTSARTSPIAMNYQQQRHRPVNHHQYLGLEGLVHRQTPTPYRSSHAYQRPRSYNHDYSLYRPSSVQPNLPPPKTEPMRPPSIGSTQDIQKSLKNNSSTSCKSLLNILSRPQNSHHNVNKPQQPPVDMYKFVNNQYNKQLDAHHNKDISVPSTERVPGTPVDLSGKKETEVPKLKVKQHLIDPNLRPKLLKFEDHSEVGSTTGSLSTPGVEETHPHLWHPLFSSREPTSGHNYNPYVCQGRSDGCNLCRPASKPKHSWVLHSDSGIYEDMVTSSTHHDSAVTSYSSLQDGREACSVSDKEVTSSTHHATNLIATENLSLSEKEVSSSTCGLDYVEEEGACDVSAGPSEYTVCANTYSKDHKFWKNIILEKFESVNLTVER